MEVEGLYSTAHNSRYGKMAVNTFFLNKLEGLYSEAPNAKYDKNGHDVQKTLSDGHLWCFGIFVCVLTHSLCKYFKSTLE